MLGASRVPVQGAGILQGGEAHPAAGRFRLGGRPDGQIPGKGVADPLFPLHQGPIPHGMEPLYGFPLQQLPHHFMGHPRPGAQVQVRGGIVGRRRIPGGGQIGGKYIARRSLGGLDLGPFSLQPQQGHPLPQGHLALYRMLHAGALAQVQCIRGVIVLPLRRLGRAHQEQDQEAQQQGKKPPGLPAKQPNNHGYPPFHPVQG